MLLKNSCCCSCLLFEYTRKLAFFRILSYKNQLYFYPLALICPHSVTTYTVLYEHAAAASNSRAIISFLLDFKGWRILLRVWVPLRGPLPAILCQLHAEAPVHHGRVHRGRHHRVKEQGLSQGRPHRVLRGMDQERSEEKKYLAIFAAFPPRLLFLFELFGSNIIATKIN